MDAQGCTVDKILAVPMHSKPNRNMGVVTGRKHKAVSMGIVHVRDEKKFDGPTDGRINNITVVDRNVRKATQHNTERTA